MGLSSNKNNICLGIDLVDLKKFERKLITSPSILKEFLAPAELGTGSADHLAGIFAAKEAIIKALGLAPGSWLKMEIHQSKTSKPSVKFAKSIATNLKSYDVSISHDGNFIVAVFVALQKDG